MSASLNHLRYPPQTASIVSVVLHSWNFGMFQSEDAMASRSSDRCRLGHTVIKQLHHLENKFIDLQVCHENVGTLRGRSDETL